MRGPLWKVNWASHWFIYGVGEVTDSLSERSPAGSSSHLLPDVWCSLCSSHLPPSLYFWFQSNVTDVHVANCQSISLQFKYAPHSLMGSSCLWRHVKEVKGGRLICFCEWVGFLWMPFPIFQLYACGCVGYYTLSTNLHSTDCHLWSFLQHSSFLLSCTWGRPQAYSIARLWVYCISYCSAFSVCVSHCVTLCL